LLSISGNETAGVLAAEVAHASVVGQGNRSSSAASVAGVNLTAAGNSIQAVLLRSQAVATCDGAGGASAAGSSEITGLTVNGGACTPPAGDFVTGGGWITGTESGARANFAVAGGMKNNGLWGHLTFIDRGNGLKVKGTGVTAYTVTGPLSRRIEGTADVEGQG